MLLWACRAEFGQDSSPHSSTSPICTIEANGRFPMWLAVVPRAFMIHPDHLLVLFQQWKGSAYLHSKGHLLSSCLPQLSASLDPLLAVSSARSSLGCIGTSAG